MFQGNRAQHQRQRPGRNAGRKKTEKKIKMTSGEIGTHTKLGPSVYVSLRITELNACLIGHRSPACETVRIERTTCSELITVIQVFLKKQYELGPNTSRSTI
jgi:hypothetical protein